MKFEASWESFAAALYKLWSFQLYVVDGRPITLKKIILGLALLVMGYFLCKSLAKEIEKKVLSRLDIDQSLKHSLRTILFYFLLIILTLFVLQLLNVPITIFTVLGSALAIGVGFGSQNIVNNFISGLILMIERPVRVGDIIEVDGLSGMVENIGARSTLIKSMNNTHMVVPNSHFLEKNVLNWTLSDNIIRSQISVGIAYGSDTRKAEELLIKAASSHERVISQPAPFVLFSDFSDSCLSFKLFFWANMIDVVQLKTLESDLRFGIDQLFRENQITIAFPQSDVHLNSTKPIQVQMLDR